jgi:hypothetical protein
MSRRPIQSPLPYRKIVNFSEKLDLVAELKLSMPTALRLGGDSAEDKEFRQLRYIQEYLQHADVGCRAMLVESPYIDRDYMEDHSIFYSRNLTPYENWCRRLHFFNLAKPELLKRIQDLLTRTESSSKERYSAYYEQCARFSQECYLGFATIKPLSGCPIGRTVLRPYGELASDNRVRRFPCIREYTVHVSGVSLSVRGLAFQQQDLGVSACATTALWSSLQMVKSHEDIASSTPASITTLASRFALPFGRPMPSEGLSIEQMCSAVQATGMSPSLIKAEDRKSTLGGIYAATISGFAPILILHRGTTSPVYHAVTVTGVKLRPTIPSSFLIGLDGSQVTEEAGRSEALYVHDDRNGPYLRAKIGSTGKSLVLIIDPKPGDGRLEKWLVSHVLIPVHPKIRLSFSSLRAIAIELSSEVNAVGSSFQPPETETVTISYRIEKGSKYAEDLLLGESPVSLSKLELFHTEFILPRYVGVITYTASWMGEIDVLVDTTSTVSNLDFVGLLGKKSTSHSKLLLQYLSHVCQCDSII